MNSFRLSDAVMIEIFMKEQTDRLSRNQKLQNGTAPCDLGMVVLPLPCDEEFK
jgi:hypothetical protein